MPEDDKPELDPKQLEDFLATARKRFAAASEEERHLREESEIDLRFVAGDQWDDIVRENRKRLGRPALTFNRMHTFVQQVSNEARQNKPQIKFNPAEGGDKDTATIYEGLARHIQYDSDAQVAYETAVEYSAGGGFGYYRFLTDYCDDESDNQDLKVVPVFDPHSVYGVLIPSCLGLAPRFAFVVEHLSKEEYMAQFPESELASMDWDEAGRQAGDWVGDRVRIAEYWTVEENPVQRGKRTILNKKVKVCKTNGVEVLKDSETEWVGSCIPIVAVLGKQLVIQGKPHLFSVVRHQRDPQKLLNVYKTRIAEINNNNPIQPMMVAQGQITPELRDQWEGMNVIPRPYLEYRPVDVDGRPAPPPQRMVFEPPIAALSEAAAQEIDDMKATAGIFDASLGAKSNEASGIALQRRQQQSNQTNMHFLDNLERAFKKGGQIIAEVLPKIYDAPRMVRILGEDEAPKIVAINQTWQQEGKQPVHYKVGGDGVGKYDVVVTMGRAFSTKRMESFDMMSQVLQANPDILPIIGDIFFANSDMAGADQLAERFKKQLPPNLQDENNDPAEQQLMQAQAAIQQLQQQLQVMQQTGQQMSQELDKHEAGLQKTEMEIQSKERIEAAKIQLEHEKLAVEVELAKLKLHVDAAKIQSQEETAQFTAEVNAEEKDKDRKANLMNSDADREHQGMQSDAERQHQSEQSDADRQAQAKAQKSKKD